LPDKLTLKGMLFYGHYGVNSAERELGQQLVVDVELFLDLAPAGTNDDLRLTVDYTTIYARLQQLIDSRKFYLIEALAEAIARLLLDEYEVDAVRVRVKKPKMPVRAMLEYVAAEIYRERK